MRYLDADKRDEAKEASRNGISLDRIAGHLGITVSELREVLQMPTVKPAEQPAADRLDGVL